MPGASHLSYVGSQLWFLLRFSWFNSVGEGWRGGEPGEIQFEEGFGELEGIGIGR